MPWDHSVVDAGDIRLMNRELLLRTARLARRAGSALVVVGATGALAWLWVFLRQQDVIGGSAGGLGGFLRDESTSLTSRLDAFTATFGLLVSAALTTGFGVFLRLSGEQATARAGGSLAVGIDAPPAAEWDGDEEADDGNGA